MVDDKYNKEMVVISKDAKEMLENLATDLLRLHPVKYKMLRAGGVTKEVLDLSEETKIALNILNLLTAKDEQVK